MKALWLVAGCLVVAGGLLAFYFAESAGLLISIPSTRDSRLVGTWNATWGWTGSGRQHRMTFLKDGTGNVEGWRFQWGTDRGSLRVKRRSAGEGYASGSATYEIDPTGNSVRLKGKPTSTIPTEMIRL